MLVAGQTKVARRACPISDRILVLCAELAMVAVVPVVAVFVLQTVRMVATTAFGWAACFRDDPGVVAVPAVAARNALALIGAKRLTLAV